MTLDWPRTGEPEDRPGNGGERPPLAEEPSRSSRRLLGRLLRSGEADEPAGPDDLEPDAPEDEAPAEGTEQGAEPEAGATQSQAAAPEAKQEESGANDEAMSWADLVETQFGERSPTERPAAEPEIKPSPSDRPDQTAESGGAGTGTEISDLRGQMSTISDEMKAGISGFVEDLRSSIRGTSESARAEFDRVADDLRAQLKRVEDEVDHQTERVSDQVGRIDDRVADALERVESTAGALRKRIDATESTASGLKQDMQELAVRIERGLADSADRIASVADGLETSLGARIASAASTAREDNIHLGRELEILTEKTSALEALLHNVLDGLEAQAGAPSAPVKPYTGTLALNSATFEQLRGIGFSVTQSARIIAYRDTHGGFQSMEQLREVRGLSQEDLNLLSDRATL